MKATHEQVDAMMRKVKDPNLTKAIFDIMKDGELYTWNDIQRALNYRRLHLSCSKRTITARIDDIRHKLGYAVPGAWYDVSSAHYHDFGATKIYLYHMPLKNSKPIPCKPKHIDGLRCWACRDDDGCKGFIDSDTMPQKDPSGNYNIDLYHLSGLWVCFPISIKPGECVEVVIPRAVPVEGD